MVRIVNSTKSLAFLSNRVPVIFSRHPGRRGFEFSASSDSHCRPIEISASTPTDHVIPTYAYLQTTFSAVSTDVMLSHKWRVILLSVGRCVKISTCSCVLDVRHLWADCCRASTGNAGGSLTSSVWFSIVTVTREAWSLPASCTWVIRCHDSTSVVRSCSVNACCRRVRSGRTTRSVAVAAAWSPTAVLRRVRAGSCRREDAPVAVSRTTTPSSPCLKPSPWMTRSSPCRPQAETTSALTPESTASRCDVSRLGSVTARHLVVDVSQTAALNRGRHLCSAGRPSHWALAHTFLFSCPATFGELCLFCVTGR